MIRSFYFKLFNEKSDENWESLTQKTIFKPFTPETTNITGVTSSQGYYLFYGPIVFIFILLEGSLDWDPNSTIDVPIEPWVPTSGSFPQELNPPINLANNEQISSYCPTIESGPNNTGRITFSTGSTATGMKITGFYIRN